MLRGIDHIVIVVNDLEIAIADYGALGFTVVRGGRHPGLGTHNALIAFADGAYLELIAFIPPVAPTPHWWHSTLADSGGLADFCAVSDDMDAEVEAFRRAGAAIGAPFEMSRERPDGYRLVWTLAVTEDARRGITPFFIRDHTPRDERVPRARTHRNGAAGARVLALAIGETEFDAARRIYEVALGRTGETVERADLGGAGVRFMIGPHELQLLALTDPAGAIARRLRTRGGSPIELTLRTAGGWRGMLDAAGTHGARIVMA